jgi:hypothetical protein
VDIAGDADPEPRLQSRLHGLLEERVDLFCSQEAL